MHMAVLKINRAEAPAPASMKVALFDVGASGGRNAAGGAVMDRVAVKRRLELKWARLSGTALSNLLQAVGSGFFSASYPDPATGQERTMQCFCGERATGVLRMAGGEPVWVDVEMIWTER